MTRYFCFAIFLCTEAFAQQTVDGLVVDSTGAAVTGAAVTMRSTARTSADAVTGAEGRFRFNSVAPGEYSVRVDATGFSSEAKQVVVANTPVSLRLALTVASAVGSVTVSAQSSKVLEELVDAERNADRLNFDDDLLQALPASGQNTLSVVAPFLSPASQGSEGITLMVDGVEASASTLPTSAIRRLRVNRNPYSAEFRRPGKARVDVLSEEGSLRRVRGTIGITARNSIFDSKNAFAPEKPAMDRAMYDANLSSPLRPGTSSFYVNAEHYRNNDTAVVSARTLGGPFIANVNTPEERTRVLGRLEGRGEAHQMSLQYSWLNQSEQNRGVGGLRLPEQGLPAVILSHQLQFSDRTLLFDTLLNDLRVTIQHEQSMRGIPATGPAVQVSGAFTGGPAQTYWRRTESTLRVQDSATLTVGKHTIRFGLEGRPGFYRSFEGSEFGGTYEFANLAGFSSQQAVLFRIRTGDPNISLRQHEAFGFLQDDAVIGRGFSVNLGVRYGWQSDVNDLNNLAPRAGFAWALSRRTVIRGGSGVFYERVTEDVQRRTLLWNGVHLRESVFQNVSYPIVPGSLPLPRSSIYRASGVEAPELLQASLSLEQQIGSRTTATVEYQRLRGRHLLRSRNVNAPVAGRRLDAAFLNITQVESSASSDSEATALTLRSGLGAWFTGMLQYSYSKSFDDSPSPFALPANSYNAGPEWGRSDYDQRHRVNTAAMFDLGSGFRLGTVVAYATGAPFNITTGRDDNGDSIVNDRPAGVARNTGDGPSLFQVDVRFTKSLRLPRVFERSRNSTSRNVELNVDAFNVLNRTNLGAFNGVVGSPFFGQANAALTPRTLQFSLRYKL